MVSVTLSLCRRVLNLVMVEKTDDEERHVTKRGITPLFVLQRNTVSTGVYY